MATDENLVRQTANLLVEGFVHTSPSWHNLDAALEEVRESFGEGRITRIAIDEQQQVLGWIGGIPQYNGNCFELHPLVVKVDRQSQGIGRILVQDFECIARALGAVTIYLGTDDEYSRTTLSGVDLYPNPLDHLKTIRNLKRHPYEFYQKLGYQIVGVIPDANGPGKPDIFMAKRIGS